MNTASIFADGGPARAGHPALSWASRQALPCPCPPPGLDPAATHDGSHLRRQPVSATECPLCSGCLGLMPNTEAEAVDPFTGGMGTGQPKVTV